MPLECSVQINKGIAVENIHSLLDGLWQTNDIS
jgi:predicted ribosome-associated RNA-binding protein Tma20